MTTAIICTAILAAAVFILGLNVSINRGKAHKEGRSQFELSPDDKLFVAIRAHGNAAEYVPTLIVLFLVVGARSPDWVAIPLIVGATIARLAHAYGMLSAGSLNVETKFRFGGAAGTYIFGVALAIAAAVSLV